VRSLTFETKFDSADYFLSHKKFDIFVPYWNVPLDKMSNLQYIINVLCYIHLNYPLKLLTKNKCLLTRGIVKSDITTRSLDSFYERYLSVPVHLDLIAKL